MNTVNFLDDSLLYLNKYVHTFIGVGTGWHAPPPNHVGLVARPESIIVYSLITDIYIRSDYESFNETS